MEKIVMSNSFEDNLKYLKEKLRCEQNYDVVYRVIKIGGKQAFFFFVDGFCKDDLMEKILEKLMEIKPEELTGDVHQMIQQFLPYVEVDLNAHWEQIETNILSGVLGLFVEGFDQCVLIDARTYPVRSITEPEIDKALRGSKDGFVETIVFNTALIRRRIRSSELTMKMMSIGTVSKTDIVICYMDNLVNKDFLASIEKSIENSSIDALKMNQETLAECLYKRKWYNPFPKFRYTERPDTAAAQLLEGNIIILVDNSPQVMLTPTTLFDLLEEADDYYFPPITGSYLRISRYIISILAFLITPLFLFLMQNPHLIPEALEFIKIKEKINIPIICQFLMLELAIDGLRLAAVNTPSMLSTSLSVLAALVLGEFSINSGWFNAEVMLYMAFVAVANYTQASYELGYAMKFMRVLTLILTFFFNGYGLLAGSIFMILSISLNKTISKKSYIYPLIPFDGSVLMNRLFRCNLKIKNKKTKIKNLE